MTNEKTPNEIAFNEGIIKEKCKYFYDREIAVHITKHNKWFNNGMILEVQPHFILLLDEKEGKIPVFYQEILEIQKREARR